MHDSMHFFEDLTSPYRAFSVPLHCIAEQSSQYSLSITLAYTCCLELDRTIKQIYSTEYLNQTNISLGNHSPYVGAWSSWYVGQLSLVERMSQSAAWLLPRPRTGTYDCSGEYVCDYNCSFGTVLLERMLTESP